MLFNSSQFALFFPVVTMLYFLLPHRARWLLLLCASCFFYMVFVPYYILILACTILVDYFAGILIERTQGPHKRLFLIASIIVNIGFLSFFKYFNFFSENAAHIAQLIGWNYSVPALSIILPIGLSFHTFQAMAYTIEVYRGGQKAERHFGIFALYVMFYPQLVAGPIERPQNLIHQFYEEHTPDYQRIKLGLQLMLWGLFKKIVIADRLAVIVNHVYAQPADHTGLPLVIATVAFAFQIYCDFSGYSDVAIGAAQVMGFTLMDNFNRPYFSVSIAEFWRRWHISLSTWFRDYLYIPLGGNRASPWRWQCNILITFLIAGLWHGANWTYIVWGALNALYIIFSARTRGMREKAAALLFPGRFPAVRRSFQIAVTFALTCFAWIFFRANSLPDACYIVTHLFSPAPGMLSLADAAEALSLNTFDLGIAAASLALLGAVHLLQRRGSVRHMLEGKPVWLRWPLWYALILSVILFGPDMSIAFIYFQF